MKRFVDWIANHREHIAFTAEFTTRCAIEHLLIAAGLGLGGGLAIRFAVEWIIRWLKR